MLRESGQRERGVRRSKAYTIKLKEGESKEVRKRGEIMKTGRKIGRRNSKMRNRRRGKLRGRKN